MYRISFTQLPPYFILLFIHISMEPVIEKISQDIEIHCNGCGFKGSMVATKVYYNDCPECNKLIYVGCLTRNN